jgi:probable rRNA maturation factor
MRTRSSLDPLTSPPDIMPVEITRRGPGKEFPSRALKKIAQVILLSVGRADAELSLALIGNSEMQRLNAKYRRKNYPTDVLSFPIDETFPSTRRQLGDVVISVEKAREQAKERGRTHNQEMVTLLIHGIVHLLGYDHERSARDARVMKRLENKLFRELCEQGLLEV